LIYWLSRTKSIFKPSTQFTGEIFSWVWNFA